ncbi:MAG: UDP-2,3-diacylglucosamine diphosphatase [Prevotellaceae bacterium]|jgi:UDP-2,3-diacylglucosamine hydrolase|nr:UDP-2,3-diacylglucosamine diphosphatase [Prevotellaceae bacterium]
MNYYFAADVHLGLPPYEDSRKRELRFVNWLDSIKSDAKEIFLLGDIFDFWFEYKKVVPRGFVRTMGKIAELTDAGIPVHFFAGNHDLWVSDYLQSELGVIFHPTDYTVELYGHKFCLTHGDALNVRDKSHALLRWIFTNSKLRKVFAGIHPHIGLSFAHAWSKSNRKKHGRMEFNPDNNPFYNKVCEIAKEQKLDFFVMGHLHVPVNLSENGFNFVVLPDWFSGGGYAVFDGKTMNIKFLTTFAENF